ncbi:MAG: hypothetical protein BWY85_01725 [Firmicutes bacterium ADurb.Bin506]|jgi:hypothetical protein|nr:MAG: hypothetical protein BWY85_01725 [Firmicutes bacterium ADurb.Bin506]
MWLSCMLALAVVAMAIDAADMRSSMTLGVGSNEAWVAARARRTEGSADGAGGGRLLFGFNAWGSRVEVRIEQRQR